MTKTKKPRKGSAKSFLQEIEIPDYVKKQLSRTDLALLTYALAGMNVNDLAAIYGKRNRVIKTELVWRLVQLGQTLAYLALSNDKLLPDWNKKAPGYFEGFFDCKHQVKGVIENGLRKKSGR